MIEDRLMNSVLVGRPIKIVSDEREYIGMVSYLDRHAQRINIIWPGGTNPANRPSVLERFHLGSPEWGDRSSCYGRIWSVVELIDPVDDVFHIEVHCETDEISAGTVIDVYHQTTYMDGEETHSIQLASLGFCGKPDARFKIRVVEIVRSKLAKSSSMDGYIQYKKMIVTVKGEEIHGE